MKDDQTVRISMGIVLGIAYIARLITHGNGPIGVFAYELNSFAFAGIILFLLAVPETIDRLPFGPTRSKK